MAGGGGSDEMNPFISYVDLFASIIMVLLLFVLIMFVNVGYYMQFNAKDRSKSDVNTIEEKPLPVVSKIEIKKKDEAGPAFHEKSAKNLKVNVKISRKDIMMKKYGKPIKKGGKK